MGTSLNRTYLVERRVEKIARLIDQFRSLKAESDPDVRDVIKNDILKNEILGSKEFAALARHLVAHVMPSFIEACE